MPKQLCSACIVAVFAVSAARLLSYLRLREPLRLLVRLGHANHTAVRDLF
jgi:hypothetical protein